MKKQSVLAALSGIIAVLLVCVVPFCANTGTGAPFEISPSLAAEPSTTNAPVQSSSQVATEPKPEQAVQPFSSVATPRAPDFKYEDAPAYTGKPYVEVNGNKPFFDPSEITSTSYEYYEELDGLDRCTFVMACLGRDLMPTTEREGIGMVRPSGWHTVRYDDLIADKYLYNRCHLIGYQLTGENANINNLLTGTRYMNINGMLPIENMVADYIRESGNHVMYRVTPIFAGENLVATGVLMEGFSVEDAGKAIEFCFFVYNVQPYIEIDYATGESWRAADVPSEQGTQPDSGPVTDTSSDTPDDTKGNLADEPTYIGNKNTMKFHYPSCPSVGDMKEKNKVPFFGDRDELIEVGYKPCGRCHP